MSQVIKVNAAVIVVAVMAILVGTVSSASAQDSFFDIFPFFQPE